MMLGCNVASVFAYIYGHRSGGEKIKGRSRCLQSASCVVLKAYQQQRLCLSSAYSQQKRARGKADYAMPFCIT